MFSFFQAHHQVLLKFLVIPWNCWRVKVSFLWFVVLWSELDSGRALEPEMSLELCLIGRWVQWIGWEDVWIRWWLPIAVTFPSSVVSISPFQRPPFKNPYVLTLSTEIKLWNRNPTDSDGKRRKGSQKYENSKEYKKKVGIEKTLKSPIRKMKKNGQNPANTYEVNNQPHFSNNGNQRNSIDLISLLHFQVK